MKSAVFSAPEGAVDSRFARHLLPAPNRVWEALLWRSHFLFLLFIVFFLFLLVFFLTRIFRNFRFPTGHALLNNSLIHAFTIVVGMKYLILRTFILAILVGLT